MGNDLQENQIDSQGNHDHNDLLENHSHDHNVLLEGQNHNSNHHHCHNHDDLREDHNHYHNDLLKAHHDLQENHNDSQGNHDDLQETHDLLESSDLAAARAVVALKTVRDAASIFDGLSRGCDMDSEFSILELSEDLGIAGVLDSIPKRILLVALGKKAKA